MKQCVTSFMTFLVMFILRFFAVFKLLKQSIELEGHLVIKAPINLSFQLVFSFLHILGEFVHDSCGCCLVCGKVINETCGGPWDGFGKCVRGLFCEKNVTHIPNATDAQRFEAKGTCKTGRLKFLILSVFLNVTDPKLSFMPRLSYTKLMPTLIDSPRITAKRAHPSIWFKIKREILRRTV